MRKWIAVVLLAGWLAIGCASCITETDSETGAETYRLDPNGVVQIEQKIDAGIGILSILSAFWPFLLPVATGVGGAYAEWKKIKPELLVAQEKERLAHIAGLATAQGIEGFKSLYPAEWTKLETQLVALKDKLVKPEDLLLVENLIRALGAWRR